MYQETMSRQARPFVKGQFLLIWTTLVLCSEQRLCDSYLHLWCKIKRIVNQCHWCSSLFFSPLQFRLQYNGLNSHLVSKNVSLTSQKWHFNSCWADKNNVPPSINSALWPHPKIALCLRMRFCSTEKGKMIRSDDVMSAVSVNRCLKTQGQWTNDRIKHLMKQHRKKDCFSSHPPHSHLFIKR